MTVGLSFLLGLMTFGPMGIEASDRPKEGFPLPLQVGRVFIDHLWRTIPLEQEFREPVVVAKPASARDPDPGVVRIREVSPRSFQLRFQEWFYLDDVHGEEAVSYLVVERGRWSLPNGAQLEAGWVETDSSLPLPQPFVSVTFRQPFRITPVVLSSVGSYRGTDTVDTRLRNVTPTGFEVILQEQEDRGGHVAEVIYWVAWEPGSGSLSEVMPYEAGWKPGVDHRFARIPFQGSYWFPPCFLADIQTFWGQDTANLRYRDLTDAEVWVQVAEEQSKDPEVAHTLEVVGYLAIQCRVRQLQEGVELRP